MTKCRERARRGIIANPRAARDTLPPTRGPPTSVPSSQRPYYYSQTGAFPIADFFLGESLVGDGNEVAHVDLIIGSKSGPAGGAFCNALTNNKDGFTTLLAVVTPNLPAKPDTLLFNKVTIKGAKQAVQMFGPAQAAVARAVVDSVESGVIPRDKCNDYCIMVGVFIHWDAADDTKIYDYNYQATKESIARALGCKPSVADVIAGSKTAKHPFSPK